MRIEKPYISICNVVNAVQALELVSVFPENSRYKLGISCTISRESIYEEQTFFPEDVFPASAESRTFNIVHCTDLGSGWSTRLLVDTVGDANLRCVHALHLDGTWPTPGQVKAFRQSYPDIGIILQVGGNGMSIIPDGGRELVDTLARYPKGDIDGMVFKQRDDQGRRIMTDHFHRSLRHVSRNFPHLRLAIVEELREVRLSSFKEFPCLSLHLETGGSTDQKKAQLIDMVRVKEFIVQILPIIEGFHSKVAA